MEDLEKTVKDILSGWVSDDVITALDESLRETSKKAVKAVKANAPQGRTKDYKNSIRYKKDQTNKSRPSYTVYAGNGEHRLTHLLEYPHRVVNQTGDTGKRTEGHKHWGYGQEAIEDNINKDFIKIYKSKK